MEQKLKKKCIDCCSEIDVHARKCVECGSFQNWRRHMTISSSMLALLIAFFSVLSISLPVIDETLTPKNSNIEVRYRGPGGGLRASEKTFVFTVWNSGNRTGEIDDVKLIYNLGTSAGKHLRLYTKGDTLIDPTQLTRMPLLIVPADVALIDDKSIRNKELPLDCVVEIMGFDFQGAQQSYTPKPEKVEDSECREVLISYLK